VRYGSDEIRRRRDWIVLVLRPLGRRESWVGHAGRPDGAAAALGLDGECRAIDDDLDGAAAVLGLELRFGRNGSTTARRRRSGWWRRVAASVLPKQRLPRCPFRLRTPIDVEATSPSRDGASGGVSRPSAPRAPLCISRRVWHGASSSPPAAEAPPRGSPVSCVCVRTIGGGSSSAVTVQSGRISASDTVAEN